MSEVHDIRSIVTPAIMTTAIVTLLVTRMQWLTVIAATNGACSTTPREYDENDLV